MEALGQLGKLLRAISGGGRLELLSQPRGIELVHRCLPKGRIRVQRYADIYPVY